MIILEGWPSKNVERWRARCRDGGGENDHKRRVLVQIVELVVGFG